MTLRSRRLVRRLAVLGTAFFALVALAIGPATPAHSLGFVQAEPTPVGTPFLPATAPLHVTISQLTANNLTVQNSVTIMLANGTQVTTTKYTFTQLVINSNMQITDAGTGGVAISVPNTGSLGGTDTSGSPETTVMWGNITNLCVTVIFQICGIQGLVNFFGSFISLSTGASNFAGDIYAIQTTDNHAALSSTNNPVHLPGTLSVTSP
jgi:hypothetical protein